MDDLTTEDKVFYTFFLSQDKRSLLVILDFSPISLFLLFCESFFMIFLHDTTEKRTPSPQFSQVLTWKQPVITDKE